MIDNIKVFLYLIYPHYKDELSLSTSEKDRTEDPNHRQRQRY